MLKTVHLAGCIIAILSMAPAAAVSAEAPVGYRAALLVEAPAELSKTKTFIGRVVWKLDKRSPAAADLAVEANVGVLGDKMKVVVVLEKNADVALPDTHTIKIGFTVEPGSYSGNIKRISVPQMRVEGNPTGTPLIGTTVQSADNTYIVGLSPGHHEAANTDLLRKLGWIDIPMLLDDGRIAKLTFEKGEAGTRAIDDAFEAWQPRSTEAPDRSPWLRNRR